MSSFFHFRQFSVRNQDSALKVGTDAVLLGAATTIRESAKRALDIGTGTGVIALMIAQRAPSLLIDAVEIDQPSAQEAAFNFAASPWSHRLQIHACSLSQFASSTKYELIFSNPPFYDNSLKNPDAREASARHDDSLNFSDICAYAAKQLTQDGTLSLIIPSERSTELIRIAASFGLYPFRDLSIRTTTRKTAKRHILEFSRQKTDVCYSTLTLMQDGSRHPDYQSLTEDFYLSQ